MSTNQDTVNTAHWRIVLFGIAAAVLITLFLITGKSQHLQGSITDQKSCVKENLDNTRKCYTQAGKNIQAKLICIKRFDYMRLQCDKMQ